MSRPDYAARNSASRLKDALEETISSNLGLPPFAFSTATQGSTGAIYGRSADMYGGWVAPVSVLAELTQVSIFEHALRCPALT